MKATEVLTLTVEFHSVWRTRGLRQRQADTFSRINNQKKKTTWHTPKICNRNMLQRTFVHALQELAGLLHFDPKPENTAFGTSLAKQYKADFTIRFLKRPLATIRHYCTIVGKLEIYVTSMKTSENLKNKNCHHKSLPYLNRMDETLV